jgi:hypothetical protein
MQAIQVMLNGMKKAAIWVIENAQKSLATDKHFPLSLSLSAPQVKEVFSIS